MGFMEKMLGLPEGHNPGDPVRDPSGKLSFNKDPNYNPSLGFLGNMERDMSKMGGMSMPNRGTGGTQMRAPVPSPGSMDQLEGVGASTGRRNNTAVQRAFQPPPSIPRKPYTGANRTMEDVMREDSASMFDAMPNMSHVGSAIDPTASTPPTLPGLASRPSPQAMMNQENLQPGFGNDIMSLLRTIADFLAGNNRPMSY